MLIRKLLFLICLPICCLGQNEQTVTLIDVNLAVDRALFDRLDPTATNTHAALFEQLFEQASMEILTANLQQLKAINLLPIDTLLDLVTYNKNGFPDPLSAKSTMKKLIKKSYQTDQFLQLNLACRTEGDVIGQADLLKRVQPKLEVIISLFDQSGKLLQKAIARTVYGEYIEAKSFGATDFNKKKRQHIKQLKDYLLPLLKETIHRSVEKIN